MFDGSFFPWFFVSLNVFLILAFRNHIYSKFNSVHYFPSAQQWWGHAWGSVSVSWLSSTRETQTQQRESADMCSSGSSLTLSWRQPCRHMMCDTSAWSPVNWRHTAWTCIYLSAVLVQERSWAATWGEYILCSCAKINIPCTVLSVKTVLGALARVVLLKLFVECWVWLCFLYIKPGWGRAEQIVMASLSTGYANIYIISYCQK